MTKSKQTNKNPVRNERSGDFPGRAVGRNPLATARVQCLVQEDSTRRRTKSV